MLCDMKLPNLGRFFHKRSRSDSALYRRTQPDVQLPPRPVSVSFSNGAVVPLDTQHSALSDILAGVPTAPLAVEIPRPVSSSTVSSGSHISAASEPVVIDALARRIQELEGAIRTQEEQRSSTSSLGGSLAAASDTVHDATDLDGRNSETIDEVTKLQSELELARTELDTLRNDQARLQALLSIPVLSSVLSQVSTGVDAEDALVCAIQHAIKEPDSAWRALLEPVTGPRSPEDYIAQVRCTLRARRDGRAWQQRAAFWRHNAKALGHHADTVTPSPSQLSDVVAAQCGGKGGAVAPVRVSDSGTRVNLVHVHVEVVRQVEEAAPEFDEKTPGPADDKPGLVPLIPEASASPPREPCGPVIDDVFGGGDRKAAVHASETVQTVRNSGRAISELYANLPPLASVTFRASHSIRSLSPKKESVLVPSSSTSSQRSNAGSSSRSSVVAAPCTPRRLSPAEHAHIPPDCSFGSLATNLSLSQAARTPSPTLPRPPPPPHACAPAPSRAADTQSSRATAGSDFSSTSWDVISNFIQKSLSFSSLARTLGPGADVAASKASAPPGAPGVAPCPRSPARAREPASPPTSAQSTPTGSPAKARSRLPLPTAVVQRVMKSAPALPQTARTAMRRLSRQVISRPVLVDSTNAAAVGDSAPGGAAPGRFGAGGKVVKGDKGAETRAGGQAKGKSVEGGARGAPRKMSDAPRPVVGAGRAGKENPAVHARGRRPTVSGNGGSPVKKAGFRV